MTLSGGCQCGALRYRVEGTPRGMVRCHCRDCQHQSGSAFGLSLYVPPEAFAATGPLRYFEQVAASGRTMRRHFCAACGTRTHHVRHPDPAVVSIKAGTLDPGHGLAPVAEVWCARRLSWVAPLARGLAFEGQPTAEEMARIEALWQAEQAGG